MSGFFSFKFRQALAVVLFGCLIGDLIAVGIVAPRSLPLSIAFVVSLWLVVIGIALCVRSLDKSDPEDEDGEGPGGGGGEGGPRPKGGPKGEPDWWPQFERDFRDYVSARGPALTGRR
jgi:hypothetical protein